MEVKFSFISNNLKDKLMSYTFILLCVEVILKVESTLKIKPLICDNVL